MDQSPEPNPEAVERAKATKTHSFVIRLEWDEEDRTYCAYIPELDVMTNADTLPEALYMAGDAGKLVLEHDMAWDQYQPASANYPWGLGVADALS